MYRKPTILVVDDEASIRSGLADTISRHGFNVVTAEDGSDGLLKAKEVMPDLILSDVMMPAQNGYEMRQEMRADPKLVSIPFIFLITHAGVDALPDDADDFIAKPFVPEELIHQIETVLHRANDGRTDRRGQAKAVAQEEIEKFRTEILRNFRDELRSPMGNVVMSLEMAVSHKFQDPRQQGEFVHRALSNPEHLESLVLDMILLSNIDQNDLDRVRQSIDIDQHIRVPIEQRLRRYENKGLNFVQDIKLSGPIMAPRRELTQALLALVDNAFKFSPDGGKVELIVRSSTTGGATIFVQDDGPGVPSELREKVFEHFYQLSEGDHREDPRLGVGLTIARAVFSSLGGDVRIVDSVRGCRVEAILPDLRSEDLVME